MATFLPQQWQPSFVALFDEGVAEDRLTSESDCWTGAEYYWDEVFCIAV